MLGSQVVILITIAVYLIAMVLIGVYFGKKGSGNSSDDFYLGGRKMGPLVTAMSAEASDMSSYLLMGLPGLAYLCGPAGGFLDLHRSGDRHLPQLAYRGAAAAALFGPHWGHHRAGLFLPPVWR